MPELNWAIMCNEIAKDDGGNISLLGIFDSIPHDHFPVGRKETIIACDWFSNKEESFSIDVKICNSGGGKSPIYTAMPFNATLGSFAPGQRYTTTSAMIIKDMIFHEQGNYAVEILVDNIKIHEIPFKVININF